MKSSEEQALFPNALRAIPAEKDGAGPEDPAPGAQAAAAKPAAPGPAAASKPAGAAAK